MRLTHQRHKLSAPELNMTAMIDVIFLLLIFFMCTMSLQLLENELPSRLPMWGEEQAAAEEFEPIQIRLTVAAQAVAIICDEQACVSFEHLTELLKLRRAIADLPVIISGEETVPFGDMVSALDACHQADLERVAFSMPGGYL